MTLAPDAVTTAAPTSARGVGALVSSVPPNTAPPPSNTGVTLASVLISDSDSHAPGNSGLPDAVTGGAPGGCDLLAHEGLGHMKEGHFAENTVTSLPGVAVGMHLVKGPATNSLSLQALVITLVHTVRALSP